MFYKVELDFKSPPGFKRKECKKLFYRRGIFLINIFRLSFYYDCSVDVNGLRAENIAQCFI